MYATLFSSQKSSRLKMNNQWSVCIYIKNNYFSKWKTLELKIATTKVRYPHSGCTISQLNVCIRHPEKKPNISYSRSSFFTMVKEKCLVKVTVHTHFMTTKVLLLSPIIDPFVKKNTKNPPKNKTKQTFTFFYNTKSLPFLQPSPIFDSIGQIGSPCR